MKRPYLSHSQLEMLTGCGEQYRRRYIEGDKVPPGIALLVGGGVHEGVEANFHQKIETHEDLPVEDVAEIAVCALEDRYRMEGVLFTEVEQGQGSKKVLGNAKDQTADLARAYAVQTMPDYQPAEVEVTTVIAMPNASHDLVCVTDLRDDQGNVRDFKTSAKRYSADQGDRDIQLTIEAAAYFRDHGVQPNTVGFEVMVKNKTPVRQSVVSRRSVDDFQVLSNRVDAALRVINAGIFLPASPTDWRCSEKYCGYARTCPFFKKR